MSTGDLARRHQRGSELHRRATDCDCTISVALDDGGVTLTLDPADDLPLPEGLRFDLEAGAADLAAFVLAKEYGCRNEPCERCGWPVLMATYRARDGVCRRCEPPRKAAVWHPGTEADLRLPSDVDRVEVDR